MTVAQSDAAAEWSKRDVYFGTQPKGSVTSATKSFGKIVAAVVTYLPQCVTSQSHIDNSDSLAGAALNLNSVPTRHINATSALVQVVTCQAGERCHVLARSKYTALPSEN